jgi:hypothetical protein
MRVLCGRTINGKGYVYGLNFRFWDIFQYLNSLSNTYYLTSMTLGFPQLLNVHYKPLSSNKSPIC